MKNFFFYLISFYFSLISNLSVAQNGKTMSVNDNWTLELRYMVVSEETNSVNDSYKINSSETLNCIFSVAYDNGQQYFYDNSSMLYRFDYYLIKNGDEEIANDYDIVNGADVNNYIAYHEFNNIIAHKGDTFSGGIKIIYTKYPPHGGGTGETTCVLPPAPCGGTYQPTPNSIQFNYNVYNVIVDNVFQPQCPQIHPPYYFYNIQTTNSILLEPGFKINSNDIEFKAEIIKTSKYNYNDGNYFKDENNNFSDIIFNNKQNDKIVEVFPNPTKGRFTVKNISENTLTISFYGKTGKVYHDIELSQANIQNIDLTGIKQNIISLLIFYKGALVSKKTLILINN